MFVATDYLFVSTIEAHWFALKFSQSEFTTPAEDLRELIVAVIELRKKVGEKTSFIIQVFMNKRDVAWEAFQDRNVVIFVLQYKLQFFRPWSRSCSIVLQESDRKSQSRPQSQSYRCFK